MLGPRNARGGIIALTREPSLSRASTSGELSSTRRPSGVTIRSIAPITARSLVKLAPVSSSLPLRSTQISLAALTITSLTVGSRSSASSGPNPTASSSTNCDSSVTSTIFGISFCSVTMSRIKARTLERTSSSAILLMSIRWLSIRSTSVL